MASANILNQIAGAGNYGPNNFGQAQARGVQMDAQRQAIEQNAQQGQQRNVLFDQGQQDRTKALQEKDQQKKLAGIREDLATFLMIPDDQKQQVWQGTPDQPGLAQHYGQDGSTPWQQSIGPFVRANPGILGPEATNKVIEQHFAPKPTEYGDPTAVMQDGKSAYARFPKNSLGPPQVVQGFQPPPKEAAPQPPDRELVPVQGADGITRYVPRSQAVGQPVPKKGGMSLTTNPDGTVSLIEGDLPGGMTNPARTEQQKNLLDAQDSLAKLKEVGPQIAADYLTYVGRGKAMVGEVQDKAGMQTPNTAFNADRGAALQGVEQFFNQYRKMITGAAAAEKELESLKKAVINSSLGPQEFQARYDALIKSMENGIARDTRRLAGSQSATGKIGAQKSIYDLATDTFIDQ